MKTYVPLLLAALPLLLSVGAANGDVAAPDLPYLQAYDIAFVQLSEPAVVPQSHGPSATYQQAYLIRLFGRFSRGPADEVAVYFGEERFAGWSAFGPGYFRLFYEKSALMKLAGREIRLRLGDGPIINTGQEFEPARFDLATPIPRQQALERPLVHPSQP